MQATPQLLQRLPLRIASRATSARACSSHASLGLQRRPNIALTKPSTTHQLRLFTSSPSYAKKGGKAAREASRESPSSASSTTSASTTSASTTPTGEDASDFTAMEAEISKAIERLRGDLSKLRTGGRFNPDVLEALRVQLGKGGDAQTVRLGDVAQVVPKGRTVQVMVGEQDHLKPIISSIQSSSLSLTPQPDPSGQSPLLLTLNIPPPTAESRKLAVAAASKAGDAANNGIRNARQGQQKKLRAMQVAKTARPDDLKKAGVAMEKVVERGVGEVKKIVDAARRVLDA